MSTPASPSTPSPAGDDRHLVAVDANSALTFEDKLSLFWQKNRGIVLALCGLVLLAIIGRGAWNYLARQKELEVQKAYATASTPEQLRAFAASHGSHVLGGIALLRIADETYVGGRAAEAAAGYDKALAALAGGPLEARALLGRAIAKAQSGNTAEATTELKQLAGDANRPSAIRAEAAYHLTSLAVEAGNAADAQTYGDQISQIEPMGTWAQRAMMLRATLPAAPAEPAPAAPSTPVPAPAGKQEDPPALKLNLPNSK
jgi:hypothetical protein